MVPGAMVRFAAGTGTRFPTSPWRRASNRLGPPASAPDRIPRGGPAAQASRGARIGRRAAGDW